MMYQISMMFVGLVSLLMMNTSVHAAHVYGGLYSSKMSIHGDAGPVNQTYDVRDGLGYDKANQWVFWLGLEHDKKYLPHVQFHYTDLTESGKQNISIGSIESALKVKSADLVFYYNIPSDLAKFDLGFGLRRLQVEFNFEPTITAPLPPHLMPTTMNKKAIQHMPIFYGSAYKELFFNGGYSIAALVASRYKDRRLVNGKIGLGWVSNYRLGIELGYNYQIHRFSAETSIDIDLKIRGPFVALSYQF